MVIPMPMHAIFNPQLSEAEREEYVDDFKAKFNMVARGTFLQAQRDAWFLHVVTPWLLSLIPQGWTDLEFAEERLGTDRVQPWRYRKKGQVPSDKVVYQWLRCLNLSYSDMPRISQRLVYPAFGIAAFVQQLEWKDETDRLPILSRQRTPAKAAMSPMNVALCCALISNHYLRERWISIGWDHQADILGALESTDLAGLLRDVLDRAFRILSVEYLPGSVFTLACDELATFDLAGDGIRSFLCRIQELWVPYQFHWFCTHDCTHDLFFDID